jgi:hypothetical protein
MFFFVLPKYLYAFHYIQLSSRIEVLLHIKKAPCFQDAFIRAILVPDYFRFFIIFLVLTGLPTAVSVMFFAPETAVIL